MKKLFGIMIAAMLSLTVMIGCAEEVPTIVWTDLVIPDSDYPPMMKSDGLTIEERSEYYSDPFVL